MSRFFRLILLHIIVANKNLGREYQPGLGLGTQVFAVVNLPFSCFSTLFSGSKVSVMTELQGKV